MPTTRRRREGTARRASPLRLPRWMGHYSAAYTLDTYGHLIDGDIGPALERADS